jgi:hypothetical protein
MRGIYVRSGVYAWDLCEIWCLCEIRLSRGCPWWLYICSQLGFTSNLCLLLQVEVLGLAGFMYPLSGLLSWSIAGMLKVRTRGVVPSSPPFHLYIPLDGKNLKTRSIFHETYCKPSPSSMRDREGPEALPGTLPERGIPTGGLLHHHGRLRSDV